MASTLGVDEPKVGVARLCSERALAFGMLSGGHLALRVMLWRN
jgi:hypothetical protein